MTNDQIVVFATLFGTLVFFVWGRWRYDIVALLALLTLVLADIVPAGDAFSGFGHPAVVTVAAVLVVSRGLFESGIVDHIARRLSGLASRPSTLVPAVTVPAAASSGFMNNVGALALFLPVAINLARKSGTPPSTVLMPLAFGSLLGGLTTLIGTPPNVIIATFRAEENGEAFRMFDFTPVGGGIALAGLLFISLVGWRLVPQRKGEASGSDLFEVEDYITEVEVPEDSKAAGKPIRELESEEGAGVTVAAIIREGRTQSAPPSWEILHAGDVLVVTGDTEIIATLVRDSGLQLVGDQEIDKELLTSGDVSVVEAVVRPDSPIEGRTAIGLNLRRRFGVNLLAISRQGVRPPQTRLGRTAFRRGDVLLMQGGSEALTEIMSSLGLLPLAGRELRIGPPQKLFLALAIFAIAIASTALGLVEVQIALVAAAVGMILVGLVTPRIAYEAIEWPIIVLLGAMIPVGGALQTTGAATEVAGLILELGDDLPVWVALAIVFVATMFLSDVVNNAAAAVLMAPVGLSVADGVDASADPFLMAIAIGASCAFLTPIGHQSNTLVMGPGGYRFSDYWRLGLPLEAIITIVAIPLILLVWPP
ncbi:MAG TPA: SLC13 family permease [Dehalococcoidia bacterium]|nr:SLC13 family permease [Dehalococcoidia bacterium]